ncbi:MAG: ribonuclease P protein component [Chloroflexi bacterium]|nr:ribonuclease P protein component [Chloroflexota bacterium]
MQRSQRLRSPRDFRRVREGGRTWSNPLLVLSVAPARANRVRCGIVVRKSLGTAVERNRYKRQVREATRLVYDQIRPGWDVIFIVRAGFRTAAWEQIQQAVSRLLQQAQLWHDREQPSQEDRHG